MSLLFRFLPQGVDIAHAYVTRLENYTVGMFLGIHAHELERPQPVLITVEMLSLYDGPVGDEITQVVDYDFLRLEIGKLASAQKFALQEHFCDRVAALCWAFPPVIAVAVESTKPDIYPDAAVGCRIVRLRDAIASSQ
ncbi:dihydroneopterin aldolase [Rhizorhapis sp.]|uniref:dihydroneopterin aldolase n=1 Tax=Rhizorhapis sp. TaxID=1968842 RepID=UPI002B49435C|nr:dihydroneopterin aldolase [Rhizorhapis sp.]HKR18433.1 dihydroneopterin aldolase [Rhizorhapis sp.]